VLPEQDAQDEHNNAVDKNAKDDRAKPKKAKRHLARRDADKDTLAPR
jgi:hypothetical protein